MRNFLDDPRRRNGPLEEPERDRREGSRRHGRNWGGPDFERVRCGLEQERQVGAPWPVPSCSWPLASVASDHRVWAGHSGERGGAGDSVASLGLAFDP